MEAERSQLMTASKEWFCTERVQVVLLAFTYDKLGIFDSNNNNTSYYLKKKKSFKSLKKYNFWLETTWLGDILKVGPIT